MEGRFEDFKLHFPLLQTMLLLLGLLLLLLSLLFLRLGQKPAPHRLLSNMLPGRRCWKL